VQELFEPWLVQRPAGSYQFAVRVRTPAQQELFAANIPPIEAVATTALDILRASIEDPEHELERVVPDAEYRGAFLKLARNLAPTGKRSSGLALAPERRPLPRLSWSRPPGRGSSSATAVHAESGGADGGAPVQVRGVLRGLSLERDWLEVSVRGEDGTAEEVRIFDAGETLDDVIGPMVNRPVVVEAYRKKGQKRLHLRDIQGEE
jgi:hypothetical protein